MLNLQGKHLIVFSHFKTLQPIDRQSKVFLIKYYITERLTVFFIIYNPDIG